MEIIVNDTNIFIDLHSCGLLDSFFKLPYKGLNAKHPWINICS